MVLEDQGRLSLREFIVVLAENWLRIVLCVVVGGVIGFGVTFAMQERWEVSGLLQYNNWDNKLSGIVEGDSFEIMAMVRSPSFVRSVLKFVGMDENKTNYIKVKNNIAISQVGSLVRIRITWDSYDVARKISSLLVKYINDNDQRLCSLLRDRIKGRIKRLESVKGDYFQNIKGGSSDVYNSCFLKSLYDEIWLEETKLYNQLDSISGNRLMVVSSFAGPPYPVFPNRVLFTMLGMAVGLAFAFIRIFFKDDAGAAACE